MKDVYLNTRESEHQFEIIMTEPHGKYVAHTYFYELGMVIVAFNQIPPEWRPSLVALHPDAILGAIL